VTCYAEPLKGDWEGRTIYPFGRKSNSQCYAHLPFIDGASVNQSQQLDVAGITLPEAPYWLFSSFGCFDFDSSQGLMVFLFTKPDPRVQHLFNLTFSDDFGVIEQNLVFGNLSFDVPGTVLGIPCNYTLHTVNVTFRQRNGVVRGTLQASSVRNFELPNIMTIFDAINKDLYYINGNFKFHSALLDFLFNQQFMNKSTNQNLSYFNEKVKHLLGVPVYTHRPNSPLTIYGVPTAPFYKLQPVTSWSGVLGTIGLFFSCLFVWWYTVAIGPKRFFWHSDSRDNSWNYLSANFMPNMSPEDAYHKNTFYYADAGSRMIKVERVETDPDMYPGMTRTRHPNPV
jgi:hypothetical protein